MSKPVFYITILLFYPVAKRRIKCHNNITINGRILRWRIWVSVQVLYQYIYIIVVIQTIENLNGILLLI